MPWFRADDYHTLQDTIPSHVNPQSQDHAVHRITVAEAERDFANLVNRVYSEGIPVELERGDEVIAHLTPAVPRSRLKVGELNAFLEGLPKLGDDADAFLDDVRAIRREFPSEANPWP